MKLLTSEELIAAGYEPGPVFKDLFAKIAEYEERGIKDKKYALKLLKRDIAPPPPKVVMREKAVGFTEAILPEGKEEKANVAMVRKKMDELLKAPVIARG
ncbi:MAG: RtcB family protein, partial [Verrucomicrobiota bacterium]